MTTDHAMTTDDLPDSQRRILRQALRDHPAWQLLVLPSILARRAALRSSLLDELVDPVAIARARAVRQELAAILTSLDYVLDEHDQARPPTTRVEDDED